MLFAWLSFAVAHAEAVSPPLTVPGSFLSLATEGYLDYLRDESNRLNLEAIRRPDADWKRAGTATVNFGFSRASHWLRLKLNHAGDAPQTVLLEVGYPSLNHLEIYQITETGHVQQEVMGNLLPFHVREHLYRNYVTTLTFAPHETREIYLHVQTEGSLQIPVTLWNPKTYAIEEQRFVLGQGMYFGMVVALALYNLFLFFTVRDRSYIFYTFTVLSFGLLQASLHGLAFQYLWPELPAFNQYAIPMWASIFGWSASYFAIYFLRLHEHHPIYRHPLQISGWLMLVILMLLPLLHYHHALRIFTSISIFVSILTILMSFHLWLSGNQQARFFLIAWISLLLGLTIFGLSKFGMVPHNPLTEYGVQIGHIFDVILLSIALADRINLMRQEKMTLLQRANEREREASKMMQKAHEKLQLALALSERERRHQDEFMMAVSHELRTPLNTIANALVQMRTASCEADRYALQDYIEAGTERLSTQVENVVMLVESGYAKIEPHNRLFFIDTLIQRAAKVGESLLFNKEVDLMIEKTGKDHAAYLGDEYLLFRFLLPVLTNACKYTVKGSVTCAVDLSDNAIDIMVSDTGPGISGEHQKAIFDRFTQVSTGFQRTAEGLGIGLTVCQRLAKLLGASLTLKSTPGVGSCFHLHVPVQAMPGIRAPEDVALHGHALIVEDNDVNATVMSALLETLGMSAAIAADGQQALDRIQAERFDVVLMDLQMPVMDGFTSTSHMRQRGISCPVIAVSANSDSVTRLRCIEIGMNDFLAKPVDLASLREKLLYWLNHAPSG